ncbi:hypothetical protein FLAV_00882 [Flavobacteriales bacterium]|nr:hypothetical protein FLAV_00882 [Flavobacteriales bacterium]
MTIKTTKQIEILPIAVSTYQKVAVRLNKALCFVSSVVLAERFVLRNSSERKARKMALWSDTQARQDS